MSQMSPRGGKHPGNMPKPKTGGKGGKSPKHQCGNQPGYGSGGSHGGQSTSPNDSMKS